MTRATIVPIVVLGLLVLAILTVILSRSARHTSAPAPVASEPAAATTTVAAIVRQTVAPEDHPRTEQAVISGEWALQVWRGDVMGGEALLRLDPGTRTWKIVELGGGAWSVETLVAAGVPQDVATRLVEDVR
jgi:hypothetical protein